MPTNSEPPAVHVEYVAPATCPPVASFIAGLSARGVRVSDADGARSLKASISVSGPDEITGTVAVQGGAERHVRGHLCSEVVSALAFVASLEVEAIERQAAEQPPTRDPKDSAAAKDAAAKDAAAKDAAAKDAAAKDAAAKEQSDPGAQQARGTSVVGSFDLGADAAAVAGPLPSPVFAVPLFLEVGFVAPPAPLHIRLRFQQVGAELSTATYGAQFMLTTGGLELSARLWESGRIRAFAGARADAGVLAASGTRLTPALDSSRPWVTVGPSLRGRVVVAGPFFAELDLGLPFTLTRDRFFVQPDITVHRPGIVGATGAVGLGFSLF